MEEKNPAIMPTLTDNHWEKIDQNVPFHVYMCLNIAELILRVQFYIIFLNIVSAHYKLLINIYSVCKILH